MQDKILGSSTPRYEASRGFKPAVVRVSEIIDVLRPAASGAPVRTSPLKTAFRTPQQKLHIRELYPSCASATVVAACHLKTII